MGRIKVIHEAAGLDVRIGKLKQGGLESCWKAIGAANNEKSGLQTGSAMEIVRLDQGEQESNARQYYCQYCIVSGDEVAANVPR